MSEPGEFIDAALQREGDYYRAQDAEERIGGGLGFYGASVGAVRGAVRDASRRYRSLGADDITALASELWAGGVFERRLAAVVLLQSNLALLDNDDLTRIEGFVRSARVTSLVDPLATDVIGPLIAGLDAASRAKASAAVERWAGENSVWLRRAALLSPLRELRAGGGDWDSFARHARMTLARPRDLAHDAVDLVLGDLAERRPGLTL